MPHNQKVGLFTKPSKLLSQLKAYMQPFFLTWATSHDFVFYPPLKPGKDPAMGARLNSNVFTRSKACFYFIGTIYKIKKQCLNKLNQLQYAVKFPESLIQHSMPEAKI
jgi:hypothetical protein